MRLLILAVLAFPLGAVAQDTSVARSLAATCANCHGPQGRSTTSAVASLAGRPKGEIISAMQAFKSGAKPATVMHQLSKGYTDEQIEMMAGFFAAQKK
jgi:cytochrome c553